MNDKTQASIGKLTRALGRLDEALRRASDSPDSIVIDATIQRFEFSFELCWKAVKNALGEVGLESNSPREAMKMAYQAHWIVNEGVWLNMLRDRNLTSHTYEEEVAQQIYARIPEYHQEMVRLVDVIRTH
ncbi:MAG: nucleotidyltransferase substrate binding protein [Firmicutes bacterium]|nr:nucleotidyltransferase substrate binding protein [Bacillota bacterium]